FPAYIGKGAIAVVVEQPARHGIVNARNAVVTAGLLVAAKFVLGLVEIDEAADKEVQLAVIVVVEPDRARSPSGGGKACFASDVGKAAIAIVVIKRVTKQRIGVEEITLAAVDQINVHPAVVVIVDKSATGSDCLRKIHLGGATIAVDPSDAADIWRN